MGVVYQLSDHEIDADPSEIVAAVIQDALAIIGDDIDPKSIITKVGGKSTAEIADFGSHTGGTIDVNTLLFQLSWMPKTPDLEQAARDMRLALNAAGADIGFAYEAEQRMQERSSPVRGIWSTDFVKDPGHDPAGRWH